MIESIFIDQYYNLILNFENNDSDKVNRLENLLMRSNKIFIGFLQEDILLGSTYKINPNYTLKNMRDVFFESIFKLKKYEIINKILFCNIQHLFQSYITDIIYIFIISNSRIIHIVICKNNEIFQFKPVESI